MAPFSVDAILRDAKAEITRLRKDLEEARAALEGRPIETAPTDGSWFLIWRDDEGPESCEVGCYDPHLWDTYEPAENGLFRKVSKVVSEWRGFNNFHRATHWMALSLPGPVRASLPLPQEEIGLVHATVEPAANVGAVIGAGCQWQVPEGWQLVPKEPTADMAEVARDWAQHDWKSLGDPKGYLKFYQGIYRAMLRASLPLPQEDASTPSAAPEEENA